MSSLRLVVWILTMLSCKGACLAGLPSVADVHAEQRRDGSKKVDIYYTASDPEGDRLTVIVEASADGVGIPMLSLKGDVGEDAVKPGPGKHIVWNAGTDWNGQYSPAVRFTVTAWDNLPAGMMPIPAGNFQMGDSFGEGNTYELPLHTVYLSAFYMDKYEVTKAKWRDVRAWALNNGYSFPLCSGLADDHPVVNVTWKYAIIWCNALSQKEGLMPCYYSDNGTVFKNPFYEPVCNWAANGYRLPTEAEWEKAARGGCSSNRFPFGNTISHEWANYKSTTKYSYDISPTRGHHPSVVR